MKLLFDQNLSFKLCERLSDIFPGSVQARTMSSSCYANMRAISEFEHDDKTCLEIY
jgi:hypothetical protein